jgi:hypothetical protein
MDPFKPNTTFPNGLTIRERIGLLCWWIGNGAAVMTVAGTLIVKFAEQTGWNETYFYMLGSLPVAGVIWAAGRGALFLLAGR